MVIIRPGLSVDYIPIDLDSLVIDTILDFNLFIIVEDDYVLYRAPSMPFTDKTRRTLVENGISRLFVSAVDRKPYQRYLESKLTDIIKDNRISNRSKSAIIYDCGKMLVKDLMEKPTLPENMHRSLALVEATALNLLKVQNAFYHMLEVMSFNYSTYTHSINVCTFALALANKVGIRDPQKLQNLGTGALLHDIGKTKVPSCILDKQGPLNEAEMNIVKRHPQYGFEIVIKSELIPHDAHFPILQHHERENGRGYPHGLSSKEIHPFSKIVAIVDVFDAMTTERSYRCAKEAYPALKEMYEEVESFDRHLLEEFTILMGPNSDNRSD